MAPIPADFANIIVPVQGAAQGSSPVVTFGVGTASFGGAASTIPDEVWDVFETAVLPSLDNSRQWGPIVAEVGTGGDPFRYTGIQSALGGAAINSVPPNSAVLVHKATTTAGRRGRGRMYWPFAADRSGVDEAGAWDSFDDFQVHMDDLYDGLAAADLPMNLFHADGGAPSLVTALQVRSILATQRRRLRK